MSSPLSLNTPTLLGMPTEVFEIILSFLHPKSLSSLAMACKGTSRETRNWIVQNTNRTWALWIERIGAQNLLAFRLAPRSEHFLLSKLKIRILQIQEQVIDHLASSEQDLQEFENIPLPLFCDTMLKIANLCRQRTTGLNEWQLDSLAIKFALAGSVTRALSLYPSGRNISPYIRALKSAEDGQFDRAKSFLREVPYNEEVYLKIVLQLIDGRMTEVKEFMDLIPEHYRDEAYRQLVLDLMATHQFNLVPQVLSLIADPSKRDATCWTVITKCMADGPFNLVPQVLPLIINAGERQRTCQRVLQRCMKSGPFDLVLQVFPFMKEGHHWIFIDVIDKWMSTDQFDRVLQILPLLREYNHCIFEDVIKKCMEADQFDRVLQLLSLMADAWEQEKICRRGITKYMSTDQFDRVLQLLLLLTDSWQRDTTCREVIQKCKKVGRLDLIPQALSLMTEAARARLMKPS